MRQRREHDHGRRRATGAWARALAAAAFLAIIPVRPAVAAPAGDTPSFSEVLDVQLVVVEAVVLDAAGRPVTDLRPADFALFEDDAPVTLEHVELWEPERRLATATHRPRAAARPGGAAAVAVFLDEFPSARQPHPRPAEDRGRVGKKWSERSRHGALYDGNTPSC